MPLDPERGMSLHIVAGLDVWHDLSATWRLPGKLEQMQHGAEAVGEHGHQAGTQSSEHPVCQDYCRNRYRKPAKFRAGCQQTLHGQPLGISTPPSQKKFPALTACQADMRQITHPPKKERSLPSLGIVGPALLIDGTTGVRRMTERANLGYSSLVWGCRICSARCFCWICCR